MKIKHIIKTSFIMIILMFTGCTQKLTVKSLVPAPIEDKDIKNISIKNFKNDTVNLKDNITSKMNSITFNNKNYFNIVNRKDIDKVLEEQRLQDSGLVNNKGSQNYGLSDVNSFIKGDINLKTYNQNRYYETRTNYNKCIRYSEKKSCLEYAKYSVSCQSHTYNLGATINITRVSNADIIFSKRFDSSNVQRQCSDRAINLLSKDVIFELLAKDIAKKFVSYIAPKYKYLSIELIEDEDIDYTKVQEKMLKNSLKLIELKDIKEANSLLQKLVTSTNSKSSTALYNLAVTYEYLDQYPKAQIAYKKAKDITLLDDMNKLIIKANKRIKKVIQDRDKAISQIKAN